MPNSSDRSPRVGYVISRYPAVSHAFVRREIEALRARGIRIDTFSIHRSGDGDALSDPDRAELQNTYAVVPPRWPEFLAAHLGGFLGNPHAYLRVLGRALRLPPGGPRGRFSRIAYFAEAVPIWRQCTSRGVNHIHAHFTSPSADVAMLVAQLLAGGDEDRSSWSFTAHGTDLLADAPARLAEKVRSASFVVCVSDFGRSQLMRLVDETQWQKIRVIRCGLGREWSELARRNGSVGPVRLLSVGRLEREKGHSVLLDAVASLSADGADLEVELVGDGSLRKALSARAARLGLADRVRFTGSVGQEEIGERYKDADIFCLPSLGEGVPVVLMEAMASRLPVVAPRIMGIPELVEDGRSGILVSPGRPEALASAIAALARDPELRGWLGENGRRKVLSEYDLDQSGRLLAEAFKRQARAASAAGSR
jgi:glycosyltransferase involved in cell wall biosynthesis